MKYLLIGGHADGRRVDVDEYHLPTQMAVPLNADLDAGKPIVTGEWYRRVAFTSPMPGKSSPMPGKPLVVFVHQSLTDEAVFERLLDRYPQETVMPRKPPRY